jgi:hypothetical protein
LDGKGDETDQEEKRIRNANEDIFVTETYTVDEDVERGPTPVENRRAARVDTIFRSESQEEIAARVRAFRAYRE